MKGIKLTHGRYWNHSMLSFYVSLFPLLLLYQCPGITLLREKSRILTDYCIILPCNELFWLPLVAQTSVFNFLYDWSYSSPTLSPLQLPPPPPFFLVLNSTSGTGKNTRRSNCKVWQNCRLERVKKWKIMCVLSLLQRSCYTWWISTV